MEERFTTIKLEIPSFTLSNGRLDELKRWLGELTGLVFSKGFKLYEKKKINEKKMRAFCCENMISNLMEMIKKNRLSTEEIEQVNECLKKEIMPYLLTKYPKSEDP